MQDFVNKNCTSKNFCPENWQNEVNLRKKNISEFCNCDSPNLSTYCTV